MDSRPATQVSKGRHLLRSAIAEAVASDPAQRVVASIGAPGWRSRTPIWVGLGAVAALTAAVIIGTMLRTGTPGGVTSATSAPAAVATPSAQAPPTPRRPYQRARSRPGAPRTPEPRSAPGTRLPVREWRQLGHQHRQRLPRRTAVHRIYLAFLRRLGYAARGHRTEQIASANACSPPRAGRPGPPAPTSSACADQSRSLPSRCRDRDAGPQNASRTPDREPATSR